MHLLDERIAGIIILLLWVVLVVVKGMVTGSLLKDRPSGGVWLWLTHGVNFLFLLVATPLAAILLAWALLTLRGNYQVGGNVPRTSDELVTRGPYRLVRHPMYATAPCISLGLACLTRSLAYLCVFCIYVALILLLIPLEEEELRGAYGKRYVVYRGAVKRLAPPFF